MAKKIDGETLLTLRLLTERVEHAKTRLALAEAERERALAMLQRNLAFLDGSNIDLDTGIVKEPVEARTPKALP